jgi:hypothetical protein
MQHHISLKLTPTDVANEQTILQFAAAALGKSLQHITGYYITKKSIDARSIKQVWINLSLCVFINEPFSGRPQNDFHFKPVAPTAKQVVIVGAGPAGLFAALKLIELGIKPIIIERGKNVRDRRRDLATLNKQGIVNPESNYCFGEGGAGTYSDGKLYTRSNKRGSIDRILNLFVQFGAEEKILFENHPHIGTNKLPQIITAMRQQIIACGGEVLFEHRLVDFKVTNGKIVSITTANGNELKTAATILATGHSARDIFELLHKKKILIEAKPFALGVRIEHSQAFVDACQYKSLALQYKDFSRPNELPPASYSLVEQVNGYGVFSFCMCPGGIIAPAATNPNELVVNGWSPSKRNNAFANSGMVVQVSEKDALQYLQKTDKSIKPNPLLLMQFQQAVEEKAYEVGGGNFVAPAQRVEDFGKGISSTTVPECSYIPGVTATNLKGVLPSFIFTSLQQAFKQMDKKMRGFYTNNAIVVATESRTSSPVRIPRMDNLYHHPQIHNLFPCAEGAGYAGGIVSAAMDGENVALAVASQLNRM